MEENHLNLEKEHNQNHYNYLKRKLKEIQFTVIEGYKRRVKFLAPYDKAEPNIAFYAKLEAIFFQKIPLANWQNTRKEIYTLTKKTS